MENLRPNHQTAPRVAVVGCGRIGSLWDEGRPPVPGQALTHAGAYQSRSDVVLAALCDSDPVRLEAAGRARGVDHIFTSLEDMLATVQPQIVSLCTPPDQRADMIARIVEAGCAVLLCEKPMAADVFEAHRIQLLLARYRTRLVLNYQRRWDAGLRSVRRLLNATEFGPVQKAIATYGKGLANNGSHIIDLANFYFGVPLGARSLGKVEDDREDATLDACVYYRAGEREFPVFLMATDHRAYTVFELDIHLTSGRIMITERGQHISIQRAINDPVFPDYRIPGATRTERSEGAVTVADVIDEVVDLYYGRQTDVSCGVGEGVFVLAVIDAIKRSFQSGGVHINVGLREGDLGACQ